MANDGSNIMRFNKSTKTIEGLFTADSDAFDSDIFLHNINNRDTGATKATQNTNNRDKTVVFHAFNGAAQGILTASIKSDINTTS